jgi:hypothetical protein
MRNWLLAILGALAAGAGWLLRGIFADWAKERLAKERDAALVDAKAQSVKAEAKARESDLLHKRQQNEDALHAANSDDLGRRLDGMYR